MGTIIANDDPLLIISILGSIHGNALKIRTPFGVGSFSMNSGKQHQKPFSMIREFHLADWFTLGNAVCGTAALFSTITYVETGKLAHIYYACALVFTALVFDIF